MPEGENEVLRLGRATTVSVGERGGKYPHGSSLLVEGSEETVIIDPSLSVATREPLPRADRVVHSHCHEDHIAGSHRYPGVPWHFHELDVVGIRSLDDMMAIYGFDAFPEVVESFRRTLVETFHYRSRPDAHSFSDGEVFDLGGGVRIRVIHAPGHTRGHSFLHIEPDDVLYLGDVDLTSFGPYYGDAWSSLVDFEKTLGLARGLHHRWYATFHHVGVLDGRDAFLERLDRYETVIADRERRLLEFLGAPRTLDDIGRHHFVYRPGAPVPFAEPVERRSMGQHLERCLRAGRVREIEPGTYLADGGNR